jgi:hypothetical protein
MAALAGSSNPAGYFLCGRGSFLSFAWYLERSFRPEIDVQFQSDLAYSSVSAYYFVRLVDDVVDGTSADKTLLPATAIFHARFQSAYLKYFDAASPFWAFFHETWASMAEATALDSADRDVSQEEFRIMASRKSAGAKIPLAAVCHRYSRTDLLPAWLEFFDAYARWNQMVNDALDWHEDLAAGTATYMLSEARRRKGINESVAVWMMRTGLHWARGVIEGLSEEVSAAVVPLRSPGLEALMTVRKREISERWRELLSITDAMCALASVLG